MRRIRLVGLFAILLAGIAFPMGVLQAATTTYTGAIEAGDPGSIDRIIRDGFASTCEAPNSYPGNFGSSDTFRYDSYTVTNIGTSPWCIDVTATSTTTSNVHVIAYLGSFDPGNVATNYLADSGVGNDANQGPMTFSFTLGAGETAVIIVQESFDDEVSPKGYTLTITTPVTAGDLLAQLRADTITLVDNSSTERSMVTMLDIAQSLIDQDNTWLAGLTLDRYEMELTRAESTRRISHDAADQLRAQLELVRGAIA